MKTNLTFQPCPVTKAAEHMPRNAKVIDSIEIDGIVAAEIRKLAADITTKNMTVEQAVAALTRRADTLDA